MSTKKKRENEKCLRSHDIGQERILVVFRLEKEETHDDVCSKRKRENRDRSHDIRHGKKLVVFRF